MVVVCPKCRTRLKIDDSRIAAEGSRFKCPKCATVLLVKKPAASAKKHLDNRLVIVGHANPETRQMISSLLSSGGFQVITAADGIDIMVKALKELPGIAVVEVALPKIYGFEVCKRLKSRPETKDMKIILLPAIHDRSKYRRDPSSLYGADEYLEEHNIESELLDKVRNLSSPASSAEKTPAGAQQQTETPQAPAAEEPKPAEPPAAKTPEQPAPAGGEDVERARRLSRTILNDLYLYNSAKVDEAIRNNQFEAVFAAELKEGLKLYENRIPAETKKKGDFYRETIDLFLAAKKKA